MRNRSAFLATFLLATGACAQKAVNLKPLETELNSICKNFKGRMGYSLKLLNTGQQISFGGNDRFPSASTIKTGVALAALQMVDEGKMKWTDKHEILPKANREASMWAFYLPEKIKLDLDGWVNLMITVSDNTATMVTRDWIGTMEVNRRLEALGLKDTKILGNAPKPLKNIQRLRGMFGMGMTTPNEMNRLLELIYQKKAASPAACEKLMRILSHQYWDDWIGSSVPPGVTCCSKSGAITRSRSDTAIVFAPEGPY
ncbi:MAG: class A beta-lactamase-related serine hydrolase, partial [Armatimonadetes bacterium]|nr:class A beta-lactamase-related serine hydrolase [Armatimonadota bacterium]